MAVSLRRVIPFVICCLAAGLASPVRGADRTTLASFADSLLTSDSSRGASCSVLIYSLSRDSVIYERNADLLLVPASITKLWTTAAALDVLGPESRFNTPCRARGTLTPNGTLKGDLILQAGGDPTAEIKPDKSLGVPVLQAWADSLIALGIRRISGDLVCATRPYPLEGACPGWEWGDITGGFAPAMDGFAFNSNVCHLAIHPGAFVGANPLFLLDPPYAPVNLRWRLTTWEAGRQPWITLSVTPEDTSVILAGGIGMGDDGEYLWVPVEDPALYFGRAFASALSERGVVLDGGARVNRAAVTDSGTLIFTHHSKPLSEVIAVINKESDNYLAESVLRAVGLAATGTADRRSGVETVAKFIERQGIDPREVQLEDGCGLSRQNLCTARGVVRLLRIMSVHPAHDVFRSSLAVSGVDGTLAYRLTDARTSGRVQAKTGTMTHVSNLAGYATSASGEQFAFAILCNNFRTSIPGVRRQQDLLIERLLETSP